MNEMELYHWKSYLKSHRKGIIKLIFYFSPEVLWEIFEMDWELQQDDDALYGTLRLHLSQQVSMQYFKDIYGMAERKALMESLYIGKTVAEAFAVEFRDVFNEWGEHYNVRSDFNSSRFCSV